MPFRWLPSTYGVLTLVVGMLISMGIAVYVSNANTNRAVEHMITIERQRLADQEAKEREAARAGREASCTLIKTMADAYAKDRPATPSATYDNVLKVWTDLAKFC